MLSYLDRIEEANYRNLSDSLRFVLSGSRLGWVSPQFAKCLASWPEIFVVDASTVRLCKEIDLAGPVARTEAVSEVLRALRDKGIVTGWREEQYSVLENWHSLPFMLMERAAVPFFGLCGFGVHLNGYCRTEHGLELWVARRSATKSTYPGQLDQLVAGGQPAGLSLYENLLKECDEEAGIPRQLAGAAKPVGTVTYAVSTVEGFQPDVIFVFDLELPSGFRPQNRDGEVDEFHLWPVERVAEVVRTSREFKFNCALVVIDFMVRHGVVSPEEPDYASIVAGLRGREQFLNAVDVTDRSALVGE